MTTTQSGAVTVESYSLAADGGMLVSVVKPEHIPHAMWEGIFLRFPATEFRGMDGCSGGCLQQGISTALLSSMVLVLSEWNFALGLNRKKS